MSVAGEINVVDPRTLEHGCLLSPDVWRKQEDPILRSAGGQGRSASVQLLDYDPDILVAEVSLLLDEVPSHTPGGLPGDDAVEQGQSSSGRANLGVRHPLPQSRPVHVKVGRGCHPGHVRKSSTFINDERMVFMNARTSHPWRLTRPQTEALDARCRKPHAAQPAIRRTHRASQAVNCPNRAGSPFFGNRRCCLFSRVQGGAEGQNRTGDTMIFSHVLYRLSYLGTVEALGPPNNQDNARRARRARRPRAAWRPAGTGVPSHWT